MDEILNKLLETRQLDREEAGLLMHAIAGGGVNEARIAAVLAAYVMRPVGLEELLGFRDALLELAVKVDLRNGQTVDVCGTGGDRKNTFNISTLSAFVVAGAGVPVAKHGNYGMSSTSGSSNVMEHAGYRLSSEPGKLERELDKANICFMHAPLFHPALKAVGGVRRQLGVKTFFNILGPLVNPAGPAYQLSGVFSVEAGRIFSYLLQREGKSFAVVYSLDGHDEVSLTAPVKRFSPQGEDLLTHEDFGLPPNDPSSLHGGHSVAEAAKVFMQVLENKGTLPQRHAVVANAALAIQCFKKGCSLSEAVALAGESIDSGRALKAFRTLIGMQNG